MSMKQTAIVATAALALVSLLYVGGCYVRHQLCMRALASELHMEDRILYVLSNGIEPTNRLPGEERLIVVGKSDENYLLANIVRNPRYDDWRGKWKVDYCIRSEAGNGDHRIPIWMPMERFPTDTDVEQFRRLAMEQRWVIWDRPEGTDPDDAR